MTLVVLAVFATLALDARGLNLFARRARRHPIGDRAAVINDTVFTVLNGRIYRSGRREDPPKAFVRWPHFKKIARFGDLLAGLTYQNDLMFWRERAPGAWEQVESPLEVRDVVDFSANQNVLVSVNRRGQVDQWTSPSQRKFVPGPANIVGVEGYAAGLGFGLIRKDGSKLYLVPSKLKCDELLIEISK